MSKPLQLAPFKVEDKQVYSESLLNDQAPHPISKGEPIHHRRMLVSLAKMYFFKTQKVIFIFRFFIF